jgi:hypothetical protein
MSSYDWITQYSDGNNSIKGMTISQIIGVIGIIASAFSSGAGIVLGGISGIAQVYFTNCVDNVYYHKIYNWRHSERNYFVIEETEWTDFYLDSRHSYYIDHTYYEWLDK